MSILTSMTQMWLTKSFRPFVFKSEYDEVLEYSQLEQLGIYVHIPFCKSICSFCPYCKQIYEASVCNEYIDYLLEEINLVGTRSKGKKQVTSLYFGGGTPTLAIERIGEIINTVNQYFIITEGIGIEMHPDNVTEETLLALKKAGVTKISIGIQSFQNKFLDVLGRVQTDYTKMFEVLSKVPFETVSMDFIFALPSQTFDDLKRDIETAFAGGANHIAIYPFIDFSFTSSKITPMSKTEKRILLDKITLFCQSKGYRRDSVWTFSNSSIAKYSSMTRDNFLGFGCSATTLLKNEFKINTFSVKEYQNRIKENHLPTSLTLRFTPRQRMVYYLFWTAYTTKVSATSFEQFFGETLQKNFGFEFWLAKKLKFLLEHDDVYEMTLKGAFYYHYYEHYYTLAYIDKMWGVMRKEAFPNELRF